MRSIRVWAVVLSAILTAVASAAAGCGSQSRLDQGEPAGTWRVEVARFSFPTHQRLARKTEAVLVVKNADSRPIPNLAVTLTGFSYRDPDPRLADPNRPAWVVDSAPAGSETAYDGTYAFGEIGAGQTATLRWKVTPVRAGTYTVKYRVAAGLSGKAKAVLPNGSAPAGSQKSVIVAAPGPAEVPL